ncbi:MAG: S-layer homology domain-containing protein, partial [Actinomycetota bacterium]|nr:S-layer homology domain-containing protein [Actinomycetota bacterium]
AFDDDERLAPEVRLAIDQLAEVGIVTGKGARRYEPAGPVTRAQMASFLVRAYEKRSGTALPEGEDYYDDDAGETTHGVAIGKVARAGISGGVARREYRPGLTTTRGQMASFLARELDLLVEGGTTPPHP